VSSDKRKKTHFTLLELLIAISLFATISVAIHSALSVGVQSWKRTDQGSNMHQKARIILDTMISEIRSCVYFSYIQFVGKANEIYFPVAMIVTDASIETGIKSLLANRKPSCKAWTKIKSNLVNSRRISYRLILSTRI